MRKQYATRDEACEAWLRAAKAEGRATVLGGGWWATRYGRIQGRDQLARQLEAVGVVVWVPARDPKVHGLWAWEVKEVG